MGDVYRQIAYGVYIVRTAMGFKEACSRHYGGECEPRQPGGVFPKYPCVVHLHGQLKTADDPFFYWYEVDKYRERLEQQLSVFENF